MPSKRVYSRYAREAASLLGKQIKIGRKARKMSEADFAARIGIVRATLRKIEQGDMRCELGIVLEAAAVAGVALFDGENSRSLAGPLSTLNEKLRLLPKKIRQRTDVDDDF